VIDFHDCLGDALSSRNYRNTEHGMVRHQVQLYWYHEVGGIILHSWWFVEMHLQYLYKQLLDEVLNFVAVSIKKQENCIKNHVYHAEIPSLNENNSKKEAY